MVYQISNAISVKAEFSQIALKSSSQNLPISAWRSDWQSLIWTTHPQITKLSPDRGTKHIYNHISPDYFAFVVLKVGFD